MAAVRRLIMSNDNVRHDGVNLIVLAEAAADDVGGETADEDEAEDDDGTDELGTVSQALSSWGMYREEEKDEEDSPEGEESGHCFHFLDRASGSSAGGGSFGIHVVVALCRQVQRRPQAPYYVYVSHGLILWSFGETSLIPNSRMGIENATHLGPHKDWRWYSYFTPRSFLCNSYLHLTVTFPPGPKNTTHVWKSDGFY